MCLGKGRESPIHYMLGDNTRAKARGPNHPLSRLFKEEKVLKNLEKAGDTVGTTGA